MTLNENDNTQDRQKRQDAFSQGFASMSQEVADMSPPAGAFGTNVRGNLAAAHSDESAALKRSDGPFGSRSKAGDIFGSKASRQKPSSPDAVKIQSKSAPAVEPELPISRGSPGGNAARAGKAAQAIDKTKPSFGDAQPQAFGSASRTTVRKQKPADPALKEVPLLRCRLSTDLDKHEISQARSKSCFYV